MHFLLLLLGMVISVSSCRLDNATENYSFNDGSGYFPLQIGKYITYKMDSIVYDNLQGSTVILAGTSFLKEEIVDKIINGEGKTVFLKQCSIKKDSASEWQPYRNIIEYLDAGQAIRQEDNLKFIKMQFPLRKGKSWDGNAFFDKTTIVNVADESLEMYKNWNYEILSLDKPDVINGKTLDSVTVISNANSTNLIELRFAKEKYLKNVGMVYRELRILDTQKIDPNLDWTKKAQKGFILVQTMIDHN